MSQRNNTFFRKVLELLMPTPKCRHMHHPKVWNSWNLKVTIELITQKVRITVVVQRHQSKAMRIPWCLNIVASQQKVDMAAIPNGRIPVQKQSCKSRLQQPEANCQKVLIGFKVWPPSSLDFSNRQLKAGEQKCRPWAERKVHASSHCVWHLTVIQGKASSLKSSLQSSIHHTAWQSNIHHKRAPQN